MQSREGRNGTGKVGGDHWSDVAGGRRGGRGTGMVLVLEALPVGRPEAECTQPSHLALTLVWSELWGPVGVQATLSVPPSSTPWSSLGRS